MDAPTPLTMPPAPVAPPLVLSPAVQGDAEFLYGLMRWLPRLWVALLLFAVATLLRAVIDGIRMVQALRIHGWGG